MQAELILRIDATDLPKVAGYLVVVARTGDEGVSALESDASIAGSFTDIHLPSSLDEVALARILHASATPPVVMLVVSGGVKPLQADLPSGVIPMAEY